jgi:hypothetical protein
LFIKHRKTPFGAQAIGSSLSKLSICKEIGEISVFKWGIPYVYDLLGFLRNPVVAQVRSTNYPSMHPQGTLYLYPCPNFRV